MSDNTSHAINHSAVSEGSTARGGAGAADAHVDPAFVVGPEILSDAFQPPSETRFKQLASLRLLRATFQHDEGREVDRLSVERVLQSAQRQNSAHKIRLALMQQQISNQLRMVEAQESRLAELLSHLQSLTSQPADLSSQEGTVLQLIRDMNRVRAGNVQEWPPFMAEMMSFGTGGAIMKKGTPLRFVSQVGEAFVKGCTSSHHLQLSPAPFNGRSVSLQEMASNSPGTMFRILSAFNAAIKAQLQQVHSSGPQQAAHALEQIRRLADESLICQCCLIVGQPSEFAPQYPWFRKTPMTSISLEAMQDALEHARFREEQLAELQLLWQQHRSEMAPLEEGEQLLRMQLRDQLNEAADLPDCQGLYLPMMDTVAELEACWKAQTTCVYCWDLRAIAKIVDPLQLATMFAFLAPYPFRLSLMLSAGLMRPNTLHPAFGRGPEHAAAADRLG